MKRQFTIRAILLITAVVAVGLAVASYWYRQRDAAMRADARGFFGKAIVNGVADPELYRGAGLFSDTELDDLIMQRDRLAKEMSTSQTP